jgi:CxxC motif-containing protein
VEENESGMVTVTGYTCPRGKKYGEQEFMRPMRTVTSTVRVDGKPVLVPVKTKSPIDKYKVADVMAAIRALRVDAPVAVGDVLSEDIAGTGVALVATGET